MRDSDVPQGENMNRRVLAQLLVLVIAVGGCAPAYNPFRMPKEQFRTKVKRIALAPIAVPPQLGVSESTKLRVDSLIEAKVKESGFITFSAKEWAPIFARAHQEVGGLLDPNTGEPDVTNRNRAAIEIILGPLLKKPDSR